MYIIIIIVGFLISWLFSVSIMSARLKCYQAEKDALKRIVYHSGVISPYKRIAEFIFDCCLCNFVYSLALISEIGIVQSVRSNIQFMNTYLILLSPLSTNTHFYDITKSVITLIILISSVLFSFGMYRLNNNRVFAILYLMPAIAVLYLVFFLFSGVINLIYSLTVIGWIIVVAKIILLLVIGFFLIISLLIVFDC